jgi:hypothetical protein
MTLREDSVSGIKVLALEVVDILKLRVAER